MNTDLLIIGGGPAGLNTAYKADLNGVKTIIIDKWFTLGGQLKQQTQFFSNLPKHFFEQRGVQLADYLVNRLKSTNITVLKSHTMIGVYQNGNIGVTDGTSTFPINAKKVVITTGATEEPEIFPGWTLPGVMTAGAAQKLINREHVYPGKQALILGSNNMALEVASQLYDCGISIKGIIEDESEVLSQDNELETRLKNENIPFLLNSVIENAIGKGEVEKVYVNTNGNESLYDVDLICIAKGMTPILEPFEIMSCDFTYQKHLGGWLPKYDCTFRTTNPSVYAAGNAAGITNLSSVLLTAEIAAINVVEALNDNNTDEMEVEKQSLWEELHHIESGKDRLMMASRFQTIKEFHHETGTKLPAYLEGGPING